jgi:hypothetical protein
MKDKFVWDKHSDQPFPLRDRAFKKQMKRKHLLEIVPLFLYNLFIFPLGVAYSFFVKGKRQHNRDFFGMCVNLDKGKAQVALIEELQCKNLQLRVPLSDIENLQEYVNLAISLDTDKLLITILQDQPNIQDHQLLETNVRRIFIAFNEVASCYQIGNAINRSKWGFFSTAQFLSFYKVIQQLRDSEFPAYVLVGPSVIDYEYHFTIRALFNGYKVQYDKLSSLLYVDRRGAPENRQMFFFDTLKKIDFLYALTKLSRKTSSDILITEANWPISNTAPWAPTSETECVSEEVYANYLLRYYLLALASKKVESVYWHQLIAPGYGLVDDREGVRKREAFYVYKFMLDMLADVEVESFNFSNQIYTLVCRNADRSIRIQWLNDSKPIVVDSPFKAFDKIGQAIEGDVYLSDSPVYFIET